MNQNAPTQAAEAQPAPAQNAPAPKPAKKGREAFRTIGEVADHLAVPQHVLRFWETKFTQVRPLKRGGNRRYYRPEDVALLERIQDLLHTQGYTIKGVQKLLREGGKAALLTGAQQPPAAPVQRAANTSKPENNATPAPTGELSIAQRAALSGVLAELRALRAMVSA